MKISLRAEKGSRFVGFISIIKLLCVIDISWQSNGNVFAKSSLHRCERETWEDINDTLSPTKHQMKITEDLNDCRLYDSLWHEEKLGEENIRVHSHTRCSDFRLKQLIAVFKL